jgi:hypothetical protein
METGTRAGGRAPHVVVARFLGIWDGRGLRLTHYSQVTSRAKEKDKESIACPFRWAQRRLVLLQIARRRDFARGVLIAK